MTTRRKVLQGACLIAIAAGFAAAAEARAFRGGVAPASTPAGTPTIITNIMSDDQPGSVMGGNFNRTMIRAFPLTLGQVGGSSATLTPGLPDLTGTGKIAQNVITVYPNFWCSSGSICEPTRASAETCQHHYYHTVHSNQDDEFFDERTSICVSFYNAGYKTGLFGKQFVNYPFNVGYNGTGPGNVDHTPYGYSYAFVNVGEPVDAWRYTKITGPQPGFTPEQAWAGVVVNPGSCLRQVLNFKDTCNCTIAQNGTTITVTGMVPSPNDNTAHAGNGNLSPGMTITIPGKATVTIVAQLTSTDVAFNDGTHPIQYYQFQNGTYQVNTTDTFTAISGCVGSQTNTTLNNGHNSVADCNAYIAWLQSMQSGIQAGTIKVYGRVTPFSPHDPPQSIPQDTGTLPGTLDSISSFNTAAATPTFNAAQTVFSGSTSPTLTQLLAKVNQAEEAMLSIDRFMAGKPTDPYPYTGLWYLQNSWGVLDNCVTTFTTDQGINYGQWKWESKRSLHESTVRLPFWARWGTFKSGYGLDPQEACEMDLGVTLLALAGLTPPASPIQGLNILSGARQWAASSWVGGTASNLYNDTDSSPAYEIVMNRSLTYARTEALPTLPPGNTVMTAPQPLTEELLYNFDVASTFTAHISGTTLTLDSGVTGDPLAVGHVIKGAGVKANTYITGGSGPYTVNNTQSVGSVAMTASDPYEMNNVQGSSSYATPKQNAITALNGLLPNMYFVNESQYGPATCLTGNLVLVEPGRAANGMTVFALLEWRDTPTFTAEAGWTLVDTITASNVLNTNAAQCGMAVYMRTRNAPLTLTERTFIRAGGDIAQGWIFACRVNGTLAVADHQAAQAAANNSTTVSVAGFTAVQDKQPILVFGAIGRNTTLFNVNSTLPAVTSGSSNNLQRTDPYSAPQSAHWTQKDNEKTQNAAANLYLVGMIADGMLLQSGQASGPISFTAAIGARPGIIAATFTIT